MKKLIMLSAIVMSGLVYTTANAQIGIRVGFNLGVRPVYVPAPVVQEQPVYQDDASANYDDDYYYLPDVGAYYSVSEQCYYYNDGGNWIAAAYLPGEYRNYDWRSARRFEVRAHRPFMHDDFYRSRYNGFEGRRDWNHFDGRGYANADRYNRGGYLAPQHFDNRGFDNRGFDRNQGRDEQRGNFNGGAQFQNRGFDNSGAQPMNQNRGFDNRSSQPMNQNGGFERNNNQRGGQPADQNRGFERNDNRGGQPANQNRGGFERGQQSMNQNGGQHFAGNNNSRNIHGFSGHRNF